MDLKRLLFRNIKLAAVFFIAFFVGMSINRIGEQGSTVLDADHAHLDGSDVILRDGNLPGSDQLDPDPARFKAYADSIPAKVAAPDDDQVLESDDQGVRQRAEYAKVQAGNDKDPSKADLNITAVQEATGLNLEVLSKNIVTNVVHYLWCDRKVFGFHNYISVRSVIRFISPDKIVFHYAHYPRHDRYMYNMWFEDLKLKEYPFIGLNNLEPDTAICASEENKLAWIKETLDKDGGIYVHQNTIFASFPNKLRMGEVDAFVNQTGGFFVLKKGKKASVKSEKMVVSCKDSSELDLSRKDQICFIKSGPYYPKDAWNKNDDFSKFVNMIMYGTPEAPKPIPSSEDLIPNIAHMFWIGDRGVSFLFYLSCLSHIYILKVDVLYIHGDREPHGMYWDLVKIEPKIQFVKRAQPNTVYRNKIRIINHMADVFKVDIMMKYGGIYTDADALWVNQFPDHLRRYDAVASYDWPQMYNTWPDYVQNGILLGKRNGKFWPKYLESMRVFKDDFFGYNGILQAYKVFERNPDLLLLDEHIQVMCWNGKCHPCWYENFRQPNSSHLNEPSFNWKDAYSYHWTHPTPDELKDQETLMKSTGIFAEIGQHVLRMAGKIP